MTLQIRPIETQAEYLAVERVTKETWALADYREVVPAHLMITFQQNGGLLLGAWVDGQLVGFSLSFVGLTADGRVKMCSEQLGVLPSYQNLQVGYQLKLAQRHHLQARGMALATWTYDPLESRNAKLNIHKLGAVCNSYFVNLYGEADGINAGLPTDRFQVDWWVGSQHVARQIAGDGPVTLAALQATAVPVINPAEAGRPTDKVSHATSERLLVEVPSNIRAIKQQDPSLALAWRLHTRALFMRLFAEGYWVVDLLQAGEVCYYLLQQGLAWATKPPLNSQPPRIF